MKTIKTVSFIVLTLIVSACNSGGGADSSHTNLVTSSVSPLGTTAGSSTPSVTVSPSPSPTPTPSHTFTGAGILSNPYLVSTSEDVQHIGDYPSAYFSVTQDIDMEGVSVTPIPDFSGTINGNLHQLNDLTITTTGSNPAALVTTLSAGGTITSLYMYNAVISSASGFAAAYATTVYGTIEYCELWGTITSPLGGNGEGSGVGNPIYTYYITGAVVNAADATVTFNGYSVLADL